MNVNAERMFFYNSIYSLLTSSNLQHRTFQTIWDFPHRLSHNDNDNSWQVMPCELGIVQLYVCLSNSNLLLLCYFRLYQDGTFCCKRAHKGLSVLPEIPGSHARPDVFSRQARCQTENLCHVSNANFLSHHGLKVSIGIVVRTEKYVYCHTDIINGTIIFPLPRAAHIK